MTSVLLRIKGTKDLGVGDPLPEGRDAERSLTGPSRLSSAANGGTLAIFAGCCPPTRRPRSTSRTWSSTRSTACPKPSWSGSAASRSSSRTRPSPSSSRRSARAACTAVPGRAADHYAADHAAAPSKITIFRGPLIRASRTREQPRERRGRDRLPRDRPPLRDLRRAAPRPPARRALARGDQPGGGGGRSTRPIRSAITGTCFGRFDARACRMFDA